YNEGIEWSKGDYLLLLSADDYLLPGALERAVAVLDAHPEVGFVFGRAIEMTADGARSLSEPFFADDGNAPEIAILDGAEFIRLSGASNLVPTPTVVVRTALQKKVGGYRPELPHAGDMELWFRLAANGGVGVLSANQAVYRLHANNMSHEYNQQSRLPDLRQRKTAIDMFMESDGARMPNAEQMRRRIYSALARDAVGYASAAFNLGETALSEELADYAIALSPDVRRTLPWFKLLGKKMIGQYAWRRLQPLFVKLTKRPPGHEG
ncbi:MAG: glycosyltransferase, partial [Methylocystis sp.]|nr:glycosyltransferase [Methylocystis sp.]